MFDVIDISVINEAVQASTVYDVAEIFSGSAVIHETFEYEVLKISTTYDLTEL